MTKAQMGRTMVEDIVRRGLRTIRNAPKRTIRNLVDLGLEVSQNPMQQRMLKFCQDMLRREDSPYYQLILETIRHVEEENLLTFGINFGWNGLTQGSARIRELERQGHYRIPWSMTLHIAEQADGMEAEEKLRLVLEGMELGIYVYFLMPEDEVSVNEALNLAAACPDCAFILLLPQSCNLDAHMTCLTHCPNVLLELNCLEPGWQDRVMLMRKHQRLYGLYRKYRADEDTSSISSGRWIEDVLPYAGLNVLFVQDGEKSEPCPVNRFIIEARQEQRYPTLLLDFYSDNLCVDARLSHPPCFLGIQGNGTVTEYQNGYEAAIAKSARTRSLSSLCTCSPEQHSPPNCTE